MDPDKTTLSLAAAGSHMGRRGPKHLVKDLVCGTHPVSTTGDVWSDQAAVACPWSFATFQFQGSSSAMRLAG